MKKHATNATDPLDGELDFERFRHVRRNAFAGAGERGGPSLLALWEMPELARDVKLTRRGPRVPTQPTEARATRLPVSTWKKLEAAARKQHLDVDRAMQAAVLGWVRRTG